MDTREHHPQTSPELMALRVGKYQLRLQTPNLSIIVLVLVIIGLCGFIVEQHFTAMQIAHAALNGKIEKHENQTERLLRALEVIAHFRDTPPPPP